MLTWFQLICVITSGQKCKSVCGWSIKELCEAHSMCLQILSVVFVLPVNLANSLIIMRFIKQPTWFDPWRMLELSTGCAFKYVMGISEWIGRNFSFLFCACEALSMLRLNITGQRVAWKKPTTPPAFSGVNMVMLASFFLWCLHDFFFLVIVVAQQWWHRTHSD